MRDEPQPSGASGAGQQNGDTLEALVADLERHSMACGETRELIVAQGRKAVPALIQALKAPQPHLRWEAAKTLSMIKAREAAPALVEALEDPHFDVRWLAAEALIELRDAALEPLYLALIKKGDSHWLQDGAHHILRALTGRRGGDLDPYVKPVLDALEEIEPDVSVPVAAHHALEAMRGAHRAAA